MPEAAAGNAPGRRGRRPATWVPWLLAVPVGAAHLVLASWWPDDRFGWGEDAQAPTRIEVAFVRDLQPTSPPPVAPRVLQAPRRATPASAPATGGEAPAPLVAEEPLREMAQPASEVLAAALPEIAPAPEIAAALVRPAAPSAPAEPDGGAPPSAGVGPASPAEAAKDFAWPPSTRLSYRLTGNYRGPVEGQARVEWRLAGHRYQVSLDVGIGPPFAPLVTRQIQSDGLVTPAGLEPRRYDEETHVALRAPRRLTIALDADRVLLANGRPVPRPAGVQDSASQFVQMTWLFTTQPALLRTGTMLPLPLALPRHVEVWTYEVVGTETIDAPVGAIEAVHVRPRRPPRAAGTAAGGDLVAEFWVAPTLQYLPVRILIRQDEETYVDLHLERLPQQAQPAAEPAR